MRILVVGAGIGGLTTARLLAHAGNDVVLVERSDAPRALGAGLMLAGRAVGVLERAGVPLEGLGLHLRGMAITTPRGKARGTVRDRVSFARPQLLDALAAGLDVLVDVRYGVTAQRVSWRDGHAVCRMNDRDEVFDFVVAADGLWSALRSSSAQSGRPLRFSGQVCWRAIVDGGFGDAATEMWNGSERVGVVPLVGDRSYVYVVRAGSAGAPVGALPPVVGAMGGVEAWALATLAQLPAEEVHRHELWELDRPTWGEAGLAFVGDAAHGTTPKLGLGAAMAVEDAVVLTAALSGSKSPVASYRRARQVPVRTTQLASRTLGQLAHSSGRLPTALRRVAGLEGSSGRSGLSGVAS